jgi:hypothetical protein
MHGSVPDGLPDTRNTSPVPLKPARITLIGHWLHEPGTLRVNGWCVTIKRTVLEPLKRCGRGSHMENEKERTRICRNDTLDLNWIQACRESLIHASDPVMS